MKTTTYQLRLWGIHTVLLCVVYLLIDVIFSRTSWREYFNFSYWDWLEWIGFAFCGAFAMLQGFLLTRKNRILHIIIPLLFSLLLLSIHIFDNTFEGAEFTAACLQASAPPMYKLMAFAFNQYNKMSLPTEVYRITSGVLMSVGLVVYKIFIYWGIVSLSKVILKSDAPATTDN